MTARDDFPYLTVKVLADDVPCVLMRATVYTSAMVEINRLRAENRRLKIGHLHDESQVMT